jgi:hypothetical protein
MRPPRPASTHFVWRGNTLLGKKPFPGDFPSLLPQFWLIMPQSCCGSMGASPFCRAGAVVYVVSCG